MGIILAFNKIVATLIKPASLAEVIKHKLLNQNKLIMKVPYFKFLLVLIGFSAMTLTSCKKASTAADDSISAQDANVVSTAVHTTSDDAAAAAGQVSSYKSLISLNNAGGNLFVGATITDTSSSGITISYDGSTAFNGILRSGTITVALQGTTAWHLAGAQLLVTYNNLSVTEQSTGNTYTLNGSHLITNVSGGLAWQVVAGLAPTTLTPTTSVTHNITSSNMSITYPNGSQRTWTVSRQRTWSSSGSTVTATLASSLPSGVTESGYNRYGVAFTNTISATIAANNLCNWRPYVGQWVHSIDGRTATVLFGTNASGEQIGSASTCVAGLGYYITYTNGTTTRYRFVPYW